MRKLDIVRASDKKSSDKHHKYNAIFTRDDGSTKVIPFGDNRYEDFTQHKDIKRRDLYILRHKKRENWDNPQSAGSLSRYILWGNSTNLQTNIKAFKSRFGYV